MSFFASVLLPWTCHWLKMEWWTSTLPFLASYDHLWTLKDLKVHSKLCSTRYPWILVFFSVQYSKHQLVNTGIHYLWIISDVKIPDCLSGTINFPILFILFGTKISHTAEKKISNFIPRIEHKFYSAITYAKQCINKRLPHKGNLKL